jgi:hypothetical protein
MDGCALAKSPANSQPRGHVGPGNGSEDGYNIVKIEEDLSRDMASSCSSDGHGTEGTVPDSVSQLLPELGPRWNLKQSRDGAQTVNN